MTTAEPAVFPVAVNVALLVPDGTETEPGTEAAELLESATVTPPEGATALRNTVQVVVAPGAMVPGEQDRLESVTEG